jgi:hypothetical protein
LTGSGVTATAVNDFARNTFRRRGAEGRQEAANRGLLTGDGPDGGLASNGKNVIMWGLPGKLEPEYLKSYLKRFTLSGKKGEEEITKLEL